MCKSANTHTSQVLSNQSLGLAAFAIAVVAAFTCTSITGASLIPYAVVNGKSMKIGWINGLLLTTIWTLYITTPVYILVDCVARLDVPLNILFLSVYSHLYLILARSNPYTLNSFELFYLQYFWDPPLLIWMWIVNALGRRALSPFYSEIAQGLALGSMPFPSDVHQTLYTKHKVVAVVNMCGEYKGPLNEYRRLGIAQLWLPTPDLCSPNIYDVLQAIRFMIKSREASPQSSVFVHCKGGRGRAATIMLCFLITQGWEVDAAIQHMCAKREVVASVVSQYPVVQQIIQMKKSGQLNVLLQATEEELELIRKRKDLDQPDSPGVRVEKMSRLDLERKKIN